MSKLHLQLLGSPKVSWEIGAPPRFRSQRTVALLGYLVAERRPMSRDFLAALFWPDEPIAKGKANLRRELHNLAQILPDCWRISRQDVEFVVVEEKPALSEAEVAVDIYQFQQNETAGKWLAAADLIRGNFLEGIVLANNLEFESWLLAEQEHWRQRSVAMLKRAVEIKCQQADFMTALKITRQLLHLTPWNEAIHRQVMILLTRTGQRGAALKQYSHCQTTIQTELGVEVSAQTTALYQRIKNNTSFIPHNLPTLSTPFIGRENELSTMAKWLDDPQIRLTTIIGLGGIGKTRLAQASARQLLDPTSSELGYPSRFSDGLYFISLTSLNTSSQIVTAIAQNLGFHFSTSGTPAEQLQGYLADKQLLLILDNFEHLLDGVTIVARLLKSAPGIFIIVTSRERVALHQAYVLVLQGLPYAQTGETNWADYAAVQLFLRTAQRNKYDFKLKDNDKKNLTRTCQLLEGMPLGLELAASWTHLLSLREIVTELEQGLNVLHTAAIDLPDRHRSMRAAFDITWQHLSAVEQNLFIKLSVFRGGFTYDAVKKIVDATTPQLTSLVNKSLLYFHKENHRYSLHELLRQYGAEKLAQNKEIEATVLAVHSRYYCKFLSQQEKPIFGRDVAKAIKTIETDLGNVRLAWHEAAQQGCLENLGIALNALMEFYGVGGRVTEGYEAVNEATQQVRKKLASSSITQAADSLLWADLLFHCGRQSFLIAKFEQASECYQECLDVLRHPSMKDLDTRSQEARALRWLGQMISHTDPSRAKTLYRESLALFQEINDLPMVLGLSNLLAITLKDLGDIQSGYQLLRDSLEAAKAENDQRMQVYTLELLGAFQLHLGHLAEAENSHRQCLALCQKMEFESMINSMLIGLGITLIWNGKFAEGCRYLEERRKKQFDKGHDIIALIHDGLCMALLHQGNYDQAEIHSGLSLSAAYQSKIPRYIAKGLWNKGQLALLRGDSLISKQIFEESLSVIEGINLMGCHELPLVGLAYNVFRQDDLLAMKSHLSNALQIAVGDKNFLSLLDIFPAATLYLLRRRQPSLALEVYAIVSKFAFVANSRWFEEIVGQHINAILPAASTMKSDRYFEEGDIWSTTTQLMRILE